MRLPLLLIAGCLIAGAAPAQEIVAPPSDVAPLSPEEKAALQEKSRLLHEKASAMRQEADAAFNKENEACWKKFLVSDCQKDAKKTRTARTIEANAVEREARQIDQHLRKADFAEHQQTMAKEAPKRAADAAEQAEKNRKSREDTMAKVEKKRQEAEQRQKH